MEKVVEKFESWSAADKADLARYRLLSGDEKLSILLELIIPENPDEATIERSARVYPLANYRSG